MFQSLFRIIPLPLILFLLVIITGIIVAWDKWAQRKTSTPRPKDAKLPWWLDISHAIFPVVTIVFVFRSFLFEPFVIPSGSMLPTLEIGDFILVNKYQYGLRLPIIERKVVEINQPKRGDIVVFRYPSDPSIDYIKRLVGLPGDTVAYKNKVLTVNGQPISTTPAGIYSYQEGEDESRQVISTRRFHTNFSGIQHDILTMDEKASVNFDSVEQSKTFNMCEFSQDNSGFRCKVPARHYFMMGDNRDNSSDSRYWGFVPDDHLRGKAVLIWFNWTHFKNFDFGRFGQHL